MSSNTTDRACLAYTRQSAFGRRQSLPRVSYTSTMKRIMGCYHLHIGGLVIIWRIVSKWRRPWRLREAFAKPSRGLREAFAERVFEKASRSLQGATTNPSRRFTNPSRRLHIPKVPRRRLGGFMRPPRMVRGWTACSYSIMMTVTAFGQYYTVFRTVDSSALFVVTVVLYYVYDSGSHWYLLL